VAEIRTATAADAPAIGRLLHAFNTEYDDPTPDPGALAVRVAELIDGGDTLVVLAQEGGDAAGLGLLRLRPSLWSRALECYLAELYVVPALRGRGIGRALLERALTVARAAGADRIDLGTSEDDVAARALYESCGFTRREGGGPDDPIMYVYEREL
jgi:ribosomal protein S18 acetylase RimI-like enzyme